MDKDIKPVHLKVDDIVLSLLNDYHDISPIEATSFFRDLAHQMNKVDGNIANRNKVSVKSGINKKTKKQSWKTITREKYDKAVNYIEPSGVIQSFDDRYYTHDAYCFRGFYPGSKIPIKITGVRMRDRYNMSCFVVKLGNKGKTTSFNPSKLSEIDDVLAEAVLLSSKPEDVKPDFYKLKSFRCMRPKSLPLLKKGSKPKESD